MKHISYLIAGMLSFGALLSCQNEEVSIPAQVEGLSAIPGDMRAKVEFKAPSESVTGKVFYNAGNYTEFELDHSAAVQSVIVPLPEGESIIRVVTINDKGVSSDPKGLKVTVYGDKFRSGIKNRKLMSQRVLSLDSAELYFEDGMTDETEVRLVYYTVSGQKDSVSMPASENVMAVSGIDFGMPYYFYTVFKPSSDCFDEFHTNTDDAQKAAKKSFDKVIWAVVNPSGETAGFSASNLVDDDVNTGWRASSASNASFVIDMKMEKIFDCISINQSGASGGTYVKAFVVEVSADGTSWTPVLEKNLKANAYRQSFELGEEVSCRYVRFSFPEGGLDPSLPVQLAEIDFSNDLNVSGNNGIEMPALVNSKAPFADDESDRFPMVGAGRFRRVTGWIHSDNAYITQDYSNSQQMCVWTASAWGCSCVTNGKVYQFFDMLPGDYALSIDTGNTTDEAGLDVFGVVAKGTTLPDITELSTSSDVLGLLQLDTNSQQINNINFSVTEPCTVALGIVYNTYDYYSISGWCPWSDMYFKGFEILAR